MQAHLIADITLYPTNRGGKKKPIFGDWYGCPCKIFKDDRQAWDCRVILEGRFFSPGETFRAGIVFLSGERCAEMFRAVDKFYLWERGIIGEAVPVIM